MPKISELASATALTGSELIASVQGGITKSLTPAQLATFIGPSSGSFEGMINVKDYGAVGDGVTDDTVEIQAAVDAAFGSSGSPHGTAGVHSNQIVYFPPGHYMVSAPILFTKLHGGIVMGAGRFVTEVECTTSGESVFQTNGCSYAQFHSIHLTSNVGGRCFNLNWDGTAGGAALQSNSFRDMFFEGGAYGVYIGAAGFMGSENIFINCFWINQTTAGLFTGNYNALQNSVIGGNFQGCAIGIWCGTGSVPIIHGVGFQLSSDFDIKIQGGASDTYSVVGCRTESTNFASNGGFNMTIDACVQNTASATDGYFAVITGNCVIQNCNSTYGSLYFTSHARARVQNCVFSRADWIETFQLWYRPNNNVDAQIEIENVTFGDSQQVVKRRLMSPGGVDKYYNYDVTGVVFIEPTPGSYALTGSDMLVHFSGGSYSSEAQQFFLRIDDPGTTRKNLYAAMIDALVTAGVWAKLDVLYVFAAASALTALTNLKSSNYTATVVSSPAFDADLGYSTSNSVNSYVRSYNPGTAGGSYSQNSCSVGVWITDGDATTVHRALQLITADLSLQIYPRFTDGRAYSTLQASDDATGDAVSTPFGFDSMSRRNSTDYDIYKDGVQLRVRTAASTTVVSDNIIMRGNYQHAAAAFGGALSDAEMTTLYNALHTYLQAVAGVP